MNIKNINDSAFAAYGNVIQGYDLHDIMDKMKDTPCPETVIYEPSVIALEQLPLCKELSQSFYGELPIQIGYCNGHNQKLNAVEYHRSSELNIAVSDMILLLGRQQDITKKLTYDTSKLEAFLVEKGTMVELFATTLHYAPCQREDGFRCVIVLPKDTNLPLMHHTMQTKEDQLLFAKNKWLIAHPDAGIMDAYIGLIGANVVVKKEMIK